MPEVGIYMHIPIPRRAGAASCELRADRAASAQTEANRGGGGGAVTGVCGRH